MNPGLLAAMVAFVVYAALSNGIVMVDRRRRRADPTAEATWVDQNQIAFSAISLCCGPAWLIVHFGVTRKSVDGWLLGLAAAAAVTVVTILVTWLAILATSHPA